MNEVIEVDEQLLQPAAHELRCEAHSIAPLHRYLKTNGPASLVSTNRSLLQQQRLYFMQQQCLLRL